MPDKGVVFQKADKKYKKYQAILPNGKEVYFGDTRYQQDKDRTPLKLYSNLDHNDPKRRELYYKRQPKDYGTYSANYFAKNICCYIYYVQNIHRLCR